MRVFGSLSGIILVSVLSLTATAQTTFTPLSPVIGSLKKCYLAYNSKNYQLCDNASSKEEVEAKIKETCSPFSYPQNGALIEERLDTPNLIKIAKLAYVCGASTAAVSVCPVKTSSDAKHAAIGLACSDYLPCQNYRNSCEFANRNVKKEIVNFFNS